MRFRRRFVVAAPLAAVEAFHRSTASFRALSPPGAPLTLHRAEEPLVPGSEMEFTVWLGPIPVRWTAALEPLPKGEEASGFADRQLHGPFRSWLHHHRFEALAPGRTLVDDAIKARLRPHPLWGPVGALMWAGLPLLFRYRARKTRRALEG